MPKAGTTEWVERVCPECGVRYQARASLLRQNKSTTCSKDCSYAMRTKKKRKDPRPCVVAECPRVAHSKGMCFRHAENMRETGSPFPKKERPMIVKLQDVGWTVTENGCWEWNGRRIVSGGYGVYNHQRVHRLMFEIHNPDVASPEMVRHTCDNPPCINPAHLLPGTHADNMKDMAERGRRRLDVCRNGHDRTGPGAIRVLKNGERTCVACARDRSRRWDAGNRAS